MAIIEVRHYADGVKIAKSFPTETEDEAIEKAFDDEYKVIKEAGEDFKRDLEETSNDA